ncbi:hypothetical protein HAZT_HAZT008993 [Hyalella azteca]|uniref:VWFD domain-containing protein n=1 Tax=Hyalella azteca TaxID=294128 RepID=A0A6A0GWC5_HYAAZ|nr:hypothetical protein HAZT_HAZT008993 [Hyalella azteca]
MLQTGQHIARNLSVLNSPEVQTSQVQRRELGDFLVSLSVNYTTPGVRTRQYQVALTGTNQTKPNPTELQQLVVLNLMAVGIPGTNGERKVCLVTTLKEKRPPCKRDQSPVYTTAVTDIYAGAQCSDSEKIGTLKSDLFLSADEKDITPPHRLSSTAPCADHITDPASQTPWNQDAIYDRLNFELKYNKEMPSFYRNLTNWVQDVNVASGVIDAWVHTYYGISEVQNFAVWPVFDWMTPLLGARIPYKHHFDSKSPRGVLAPFSSAAQCTVTAEQVSTFDGVQYSKEPCTCWTVAAQVYHEDDAFTVLARRASHSADAPAQVKILAPGIAKLEMEGQTVKINDQTVSVPTAIKTPSGQVVGSVNAVDNGIQVSVPGKFKVSLQEESTVQISLPERYRSKMQGLCGDYNADSSEDLKSPAKVVFPTNKGQLFAASWIPQKGQCSDNDMQPLIKKVNEIESSGHRSSSRH